MKSYRGTIVYPAGKHELVALQDGYILVEDGIVQSVTQQRPDCEVTDYSGKLILPAFCDLHLHAPQYPNCGLGYDEELLPWLEKYTFPTELKAKDVQYARGIYQNFIKNLWKYGLLHSVVFSSIHEESTDLLFELFKEAGLMAYVGKVNMDRNSQELEEETEESLQATERLISKYGREEKIKPIITPRFVPSCSNSLMEGLQKLIERYELPVQSHLSENKKEVEWVCQLHPECPNYASVYDKYSMLGYRKTVMAHCIYCTEEEKELLQRESVFVAHCPTSNLNLKSGIAPIREYLERGIQVGLGTDVAGGETFNMMRVMVAAIWSSKMYQIFLDEKKLPLTVEEAFYLATKGGGEFFGKTGSFERGYYFDALIVDAQGESAKEKLEAFVYQGDDRNILLRYLHGEVLPEPFSKSNTPSAGELC